MKTIVIIFVLLSLNCTVVMCESCVKKYQDMGCKIIKVKETEEGVEKIYMRCPD